MSEVINGVPRELIQRAANYLKGYDTGKELRALLTAQPQASAEIPFAGFDPNFCPGSNPDNPQIEEEEPEQASAAQSAPAGFDFTIEDRGECRVLVWSGNNGCRPASDEECAMWDAITAWQRTQSAQVPNAPLPHWEPCNPGCDPEFNGSRSRHCAKLCHNAREALAAAPAQPAARQDSNPEHTLFNEIRTSTPVSEYGEPLRYLISEQQLQRIRALESGNPAAQDMVRAALSPENQRIVPVEPLLADPHPLAAAQDQGEVQSK